MWIYKFLNKYQHSSVTLKATVWYTICNMLQKLAAFLIVPCLTRMLSMEEYGLYTIFLSWLDIFEIVATLRIYSNGYVAGLVKNNDDQSKYTCSVQFASLVVTSVFFAIFYLLSPFISKQIQLEPQYIFLMFLSYYATANIGIWSARQRVNNRYKMMVLVTLCYSVLAPICSIIAATVSTQKLYAAINVRVWVQFAVSLPFLLGNIFGKNKSIVWKYCIHVLKYNFPLVPYYLSMVLLNNSDRIMIQRMIGESEAAIYSVAYSISMTISVFSSALNLSIQPWMFNKLKNNTNEDISLTMSLTTVFITILNLFVLVSAPELITIIVSDKYCDAKWTMPPIVISLLVIFIYQQFLNIHFYFGKSKIIFTASVTAAGLNLLLNYIFIRLWGYIAAGYTTLISYSIIAILYYVTMKQICKNKNINYRKYFNTHFIISDVFIFIIIAAIMMFLYPYPLIRYGLIIVFILVVFSKRNDIIKLYKSYVLVQRGL